MLATKQLQQLSSWYRTVLFFNDPDQNLSQFDLHLLVKQRNLHFLNDVVIDVGQTVLIPAKRQKKV